MGSNGIHNNSMQQKFEKFTSNTQTGRNNEFRVADLFEFSVNACLKIDLEMSTNEQFLRNFSSNCAQFIHNTEF